MAHQDFKGVWPVLAIPFLENGELDELGLKREIDFELQQGVDGIVIFGLASELYKLSEQERVRITEITVSHVNGQVPIIAGTEHTGSEIAAQRSYQAQELGVNGVMVYPPTFVKPDEAGVMEYYQMISNAIQIPIMIQDAQAWTQVPLPSRLLVKMHSQFLNVQYVKVETVPTGPKISKIAEESNGQMRVFGGYGGLNYIDEMERGAIGTLIPAAIPDRFLAIHRAFHEGDRENSEWLHHQLLPFLLFEMASLDSLIEIQKWMFHQAGIFKTPNIRKPHIALDRKQHQTLEKFLKKHDLSLFRSLYP